MQSDIEKVAITRRAFLGGSLVGLAAVGIGWKIRQGSERVISPIDDLGSYEPAFFTTDEWECLLAMCDRLIPSSDDGPGALEAHVPVFIDKQMLTPYGRGGDWYMEGPFESHASALFGYQLPFNLQTLYRKGLSLVDRHCQKAHGMPFAELSTDLKDQTLGDLEHGRIDFAQLGEPDLGAAYFFVRLLDNTKEGYLADPQYGGNWGMASWVMIDFPGARASFPEWIKIHNVKYPLGPVDLAGHQAKQGLRA